MRAFTLYNRYPKKNISYTYIPINDEAKKGSSNPYLEETSHVIILISIDKETTFVEVFTIPADPSVA